MSAIDVPHEFGEPVTVTNGQEPPTPRPGPPKRRRGVDGLPERIEVKLDQALPPPPSYAITCQ